MLARGFFDRHCFLTSYVRFLSIRLRHRARAVDGANATRKVSATVCAFHGDSSRTLSRTAMQGRTTSRSFVPGIQAASVSFGRVRCLPLFAEALDAKANGLTRLQKDR